MNKEILKNISILYVEDENDVREFTSKLLSSLLKKVYCASNGQEGLEVYKQNKDDIDSELKEVYQISIGTNLTIHKAKIFTNGTSGFSHLYVLGSIYAEDLKKEVSFEYNYGEKKYSLYSNEEEYWSFDKAIWENEKIVGKFYFN